MRWLLVFLPLIPVILGGCAEVFRGPRVVTYSEDRFYVRHVPAANSRSNVDELANEICQTMGRTAGLESAEQFAPVDIRYATYRCVSVVLPPDVEEPEAGS
jgi:hypothetical protein